MKPKWQKPKDMPKRPLSAYNLFFRQERQRLIDAGDGKLGGFAGLSRKVSAKWKKLDAAAKQPFALLAKDDQIRYKREIKQWRRADSSGVSSGDDETDDEKQPARQSLASYVPALPETLPHVAQYASLPSPVYARTSPPAEYHVPPRQDVANMRFASPPSIHGALSTAHMAHRSMSAIVHPPQYHQSFGITSAHRSTYPVASSMHGQHYSPSLASMTPIAALSGPSYPRLNAGLGDSELASPTPQHSGDHPFAVAATQGRHDMGDTMNTGEHGSLNELAAKLDDEDLSYLAGLRGNQM